MSEESEDRVASRVSRGRGGTEAELDPETHVLARMLKAPGTLTQRIRSDDGLLPLAIQLLTWGLIFHAVYGFALALFHSFEVASMTAVKAACIALCSAGLCLPSLYVFSCVAGLPITVKQAVALAASVPAMTGLLLLGLTPVSWLFSVSTNSLPFVVVSNLLAWGLAVSFSCRFFALLNRGEEGGKPVGLNWWLVIYIIVSLQMTTTMRPLLGMPDSGGLRPREKKFFLAHFQESFRKQNSGWRRGR